MVRQPFRLAAHYGLALGDVISVAETPPSPFGGYGYGETEGPFGLGRYAASRQTCDRARGSVKSRRLRNATGAPRFDGDRDVFIH